MRRSVILTVSGATCTAAVEPRGLLVHALRDQLDLTGTRDDPAVLAREMATLRRSCHRLVWLDPLAGQPGFEPLAQGLVAALPHVDEFVPCGNVRSLAALADRLGDWGARRRA
jgi:uncharacterized protein with von Willebrand factor type A (vWA) domain